jgi:anaerobic magnesium-protoporphyrin IX monomethyl ester cyclase
MNVFLIRPPATFYPGAIEPSVSLPLGLLSIAAVLEREVFGVTVYDAQVNMVNPVSSEGETLLMGDDWVTVEAKITAIPFDIVGISCGFSTQLSNALRVAAVVKKIRPRTIVIVGGPPASVLPGSFLGLDSPVDIICIGEGEYTMLELVRTVSTGQDHTRIAGTAVWSDGIIQYNPPRPRIEFLDDLPFPAYHLVEMENYFRLFELGYLDRPVTFSDGFQRAVSVVTSRGCPYNCIFCSIHLHMGKRWRGNSVQYVAEHIALLVKKYGVKHIHFEDDNISYSRTRFEGIVANLAGFEINWDTPNGVRVDTLTEPLIEKCRKSGCTYLVFGVESGSQRILDTVVDKRLDLQAVLNAAYWCHKAGLDAMAFFVIGLPGETHGDMMDTVSFAMALKKDFDVTPLISVATPLPGTKLERLCLDAGFIDSPLKPQNLAAMTQGNFPMDGGTFTASDTKDVRQYFFREYRRAFFFGVIGFFASNPAACWRFIKILFRVRNRMTLKGRILSIMQVKNTSLVR